MVSLIPLTQNKFAIIDEDDFAELNKHKWYFFGGKYAARKVKGEVVFMHNQLFGCKGVDHRDRDGLNNTRGNLRKASHGQNMLNKASYRGSTSKYKGVYRVSRGNKWNAQIAIQREQIFLGQFSSEKEAALEYDKAARRYHGEFAYLNFGDN